MVPHGRRVLLGVLHDFRMQWCAGFWVCVLVWKHQCIANLRMRSAIIANRRCFNRCMYTQYVRLMCLLLVFSSMDAFTRAEEATSPWHRLNSPSAILLLLHFLPLLHHGVDALTDDG